MRKIIAPAIPAKIEYYCDGCKKRVSFEMGNEFAVAIQGSFGFNSPCDGLNFGMNLCGECGIKLVNHLDSLFNVRIETGFGLDDPFFKPLS